MENPQKKLEDNVIIEKLLKEMRYSANSFAKELGLTASAIYHIIKGENKLSQDLANRIILRFPEVNLLFLTLGQEPIILHKHTAQSQKNVLDEDIPNLNSFDSIPGTLKNIEKLMQELVEQGRLK